jgi:hypothetical protein
LSDAPEFDGFGLVGGLAIRKAAGVKPELTASSSRNMFVERTVVPSNLPIAAS